MDHNRHPQPAGAFIAATAARNRNSVYRAILPPRPLFNELGRRVGVGPGLGTMPVWRMMLLLLPAAIVLATIGGLIPARWAASLRVADALRHE